MSHETMTLTGKELAYALLLRDVRPTLAGYQYDQWRKLCMMVAEDYVRTSRWERFREVCERGQ